MEQLISLKSMSRLRDINFGKLFSKPSSTGASPPPLPPTKGVTTSKLKSLVPSIFPNDEEPTTTKPTVRNKARETKDLTKFNSTNDKILSEQKRQTKLLGNIASPPKIVSNKRDKLEQSNFLRLETTLKDHQTATTTTLSGEITDKFDKVGKNIVSAITHIPSSGGAGGGLVEDVIEGGLGGKKPGVFGRIGGKAKGALGKVTKPFTKVGGAIARTAGKVAAPLGTLGSTSVGSVLSGGAGIGTTAAAAGGVLAAGAAGYAVGTGINKIAQKIAGREDWLFGWIGDRQEEKAKKKAKADNYNKWKSMLSSDVINLMGGKENFDASKFLSLRTKGLVASKDGVWYTKGEYDLMEVDEVNLNSAEADKNTPPFPAHLLDMTDNLSDKDKETITKALEKRKELTNRFSPELLKDFTSFGEEGQLSAFLDSYKALQEEYSSAEEGRAKDIIGKRLEQDEEYIKKLTGLKYGELESAYKEKVAKEIDSQIADVKAKYTPLPEASTPPVGRSRSTTKRTVPSMDVLDAESKQMGMLGKMKSDRIDALQSEIDVTKDKLSEASGFFNKRRLTEKIRELQVKKSSFESMSDEEYGQWLTNATKEAKQSLNEMRRARGGTTFKSAAFVDSEIERLTKETQALESETRAVKAPRVMSKAKSEIKAAAVIEPAKPPAAEVVKTASDKTKAEKIITTETIKAGGTPEQRIKVIPVPVPSPHPPKTNVRELTLDDPKIDLLNMGV